MSNDNGIGSGALSALSKVYDVIFLSVLWVIFCIPIITIGPATTALYYTTAKVIRRGRGYVWQEFWHAFKTNFVTGAIYTIVLAAIAIILYYGLNITQDKVHTMTRIIRYSYIFLIFIISCGYSFLFPILSRFNLRRFQMFKMSFMISLKHFPTTIILLLLLLGGATVLIYVIPLVIFIPSIIALLCSLLIERVFKLYLPKPEAGIPLDELPWYQTF